MVQPQHQMTFLPPIRSADGQTHPTSNGGHYYNGYPPMYPAYSNYAYPQYPQHPASYRYPPVYPPGAHSTIYPYPYHSQSHPSPASTQQELHTPSTAHYGTTGLGTVQPSAFGAWSEHVTQTRQPEATIPGNAIGSEEEAGRRESTSTESEQEESYASRPSPTGTVEYRSDPNDSDYGSTTTLPASGKAKQAKVKAKKKKRKQKEFVIDGNVTFTTDSEVKQTSEVSVCCRPWLLDHGPHLNMP